MRAECGLHPRSRSSAALGDRIVKITRRPCLISSPSVMPDLDLACRPPLRSLARTPHGRLKILPSPRHRRLEGEIVAPKHDVPVGLVIARPYAGERML